MNLRLKKNRVLILLVTGAGLSILTTQSCTKSSNEIKANPNVTMQLADEALSGGVNGTIDLTTNQAFAQPLPAMLTADVINFKVGRSFFHTNWVTAPASTISVDGLGPIFNARSCNSCHVEDGRGRTPFTDNESLSSLLIRVSILGQDAHGGPMPDPQLGTQIRNNAIVSATADGDVKVSYADKVITYPDGSTTTLQVPTYHFSGLRAGHATNFMFSPRIAPQLPGLGLLEAIPEQTLLAQADPNDANGDGISGRPNYVWSDVKQKTVMGRFGWKANEPSVRQQTAAALSGDMGLTSPIYPEANLFGTAKEMYGSLPDGSNKPGEPELPEPFFSNTVFYTQALAVPQRRNWKDAAVQKGKILFAKASCNSCHTPEYKTGNFAEIPLLSNQIIHPFTDLLLHDMGSDLADNRPDFLATGSEWRTPPLWGIGLLTTVSGNESMSLLHDGRARNVEEAILWHGGEAENSKKAFMQLSKEDRTALIKFVKDL